MKQDYLLPYQIPKSARAMYYDVKKSRKKSKSVFLENCIEQSRKLNHIRMRNEFTTSPYFHGIEFKNGLYFAIIYHWSQTEKKKRKESDWKSNIQFDDSREALQFAKDYAERNGIETEEE